MKKSVTYQTFTRWLAPLLVCTGLLFGSLGANAQTTYTIPGSYLTIAEAITALNTPGFVGAGGVIFNVAAGHTENTIVPLLITATGTSGNPIVIQKSGSGANPVVTRTDGGSLSTSTSGGQGDAVIIIQGSDFLTINGIDVATTSSGIEYGYFIRKASATDGCKDISVKNANVTMTKGTSQYVVGMYCSNLDPTSTVSSASGVTVNSVGGRNERVYLTGNFISNVHIGIILRGYAHTSTPYNYYDQDCVVGASGEGNTITNIAGGSANTAYGIYIINHNNANTSYNAINNTANGGTAATALLYGIFHSTGTTSTFTARYNEINVTHGGGGTFGLYGINSAATGNLTIENNQITLNSTGAVTSGTFGYIYNTSATASTLVNINYNVFNGSTVNTSGTTTLIYNNSSQTTSGAITNISYNTTSGTISRTGTAGNFNGYYNNASPTTTENIFNNTFNSIQIAGSSAFIGINSTTAALHTHNIYQNTISNITGYNGSLTGINITTSGTRNIYNNTISGFTCENIVTGISSGSGGTNISITKNSINDLTSNINTVSTGVVNGILITSGATGCIANLVNNYIYNLKAPNSTSIDAIRGISSTSTNASTTYRVYYNTIYLDAASSGTNFGSSGVFVTSSSNTTSTSLDLRNNIILNNSTQNGTGITVALRRNGIDLANFAPSSNNNCLFAGTIYYNGTTGYTTIGDYQTHVTPRESASFSETPPFVSTSFPYDLHLSTGTPTQCEAGGQAITGYTDDFDGDPRSATPDVGADEGAFTGLDLTPPTITYTALGNTLVPGARTLRVKITDASGVPQVGTGIPVLYWNVNDGVWNAATGIYLSADTFEFTLGGTALPGDKVSYFVVAQDGAAPANIACLPFSGAAGFSADPPAVGTTPDFPSVYVIILPLTGIKTIDNTLPTAGSNYTNFVDAFFSLNNHGIGAGGVTFHVTPGQVYPTFVLTGTAALQLNATGTATDPVVFMKSGTGPNPLITLTGTSATNEAGIWLNGSDYITFDGINLNDAGNGMERGFYLAGSATNGCQYNTIKNCGITLSNTSGNTNVTGVYVQSTATDPAGKNSYNQFLNNTISNVFYGYRINGVSSHFDAGNIIGNENNGVHLIQNVGYAGSAVTHGINISYQDAIEIHHVKIENIQNTNTTNVAIQMVNACSNFNIHDNWIRLMTGPEAYGMNFAAGASSGTNYFRNNIIEDFTIPSGNLNVIRDASSGLGTLNINNNIIRNMTHTGTTGTLSIEGIYLNSASTFNVSNNQIYGFTNNGTATANVNGINILNSGNNSTIFNNFISDLKAPASTAVPGTKGIRVNAGTVKLYHNTVLLNYTSTVATNASAAVHVSAAPTSLEMINNIFANKCDMTTGARAAAFWWPSTNYSALSVNTNNNIYYTGSVPDNKYPIFYDGTNIDQTLGAYQARMVTRDQGAMTEDVPFINSTTAPYDLHIQPAVLTFAESNGFKIAGLADDIDGDIRFGEPGYAGTGLATDVGADEFTGNPNYTCTTPPMPGSTIASSNPICFGSSTTLSLQNPATGNGVQYQWKESSDGVTFTNMTGATAATQVVTPLIPMWYYCNVTCLNDPQGTVSSTTVPVTFAHSILSTTPATRCGTGTVTLEATATPGSDVLWYNVPSGGSPVNTGASFTTPILSVSTTYYVAAGQFNSMTGAKPAPGSTSNTSLSNYGLRFDAFVPFKLDSVDIYPATAAGTANVALYDNTGALVAGPIAIAYPAGNGSIPYRIGIGFFVPVGTQFRLMINSMSGGNLVRESSGISWPYSNSWFSVTNGCSGAGGSSTSTSYYWFYNWKVTDECVGLRLPVPATVTPAPAITANATATTICEGQNTTLSVTSFNDPNYTYTWNPGQLVGDAHTVTPTVTTTYTVTAVDNSGLGNDGCVNMADVVITVNPLPAPVSVLPAISDVCPDVVVPIEATGGYDFSKQANAYVFRASSGAYTPLSGGTTVPIIQADDAISSAIPIGFPFKYSGNTYTNLYASSNGFVSFNSGAVNAATNNMTTAATTMLPLIAPLWDDLDGANGGGTASYLTSGTPGNQVFTFEWLNWEWNWQATTAVISFQVKLYENDGHIEFIYRQESGAYNPGTTGGASIGFAGTTTGNFLSLNGSGVSPIASSSTETSNIATKPATGQVYSFYPPSFAATWSPTAGLYLDPAATTTPYNGENVMQVYAKPATSTTYTVQISTPANCSVSATSVVNLLPLPAVTVPNTTEYICPGDSKTLSFDLTGTPPWSITVSDGTGVTNTTGIMTTPWTYQVSPNVPTTYTVTSLTDAICTSSPGVTVTVDFHPVPMPVITGTSPICVEGSTVLDAGAGYVTYLWSDQSTIQTLAVDGTPIGPNGTAVFWVTVTNQFGCEGSVSSTVATFPELIADAGPDISGCPGFSAQLDANGIGGGGTYIQYDWSPVSGISAINIKNPVATPTVATTYTVTITDNNMCVASDDVVVFFADQVPPTVITKNATVYLNAFGQASITVNDIDDGSYDNCAIVSMVLDNTDFYCNNIGAQNMVTLTVTDVMQNTASATAYVTVLDTIAPTVVTQNITVYLDASGMATITPGQVNVPFSYSTMVGTNDNCWQIASLALDKTTFDCTNLGPNTVTLTATDPYQNSGSATATVTVLDNIPPVIQCATPASSYAANTGQCSWTVPNTALDPVSVTDNCAGTTWTNNFTNTATLLNAVFPVGTHQVTWTALDASSNPATCMQTINVTDLQEPTITCPQPAAQYLVNSGCYYAVPGTALDVTMAMVSDNCGILSIINSFTGTSTLQGAQFPRGTTQVTWTVTDLHNNIKTCSYNVFVKGYNLAGKFTYYKLNNSGVPVNPAPVLDNIAIQLRDAGNNVVAQTVTDQAGNYSFTDLCLGTYYVDATSTKPHGSINVTDAIQAFQWGTTPFAIQKVRFRAGDVVPSNFIDMGDALAIVNYFINGNTPSWYTTWKFWKTGETVNVNNPAPSLNVPYVPVVMSGNHTVNFYGMVTGDFNGSYSPVAGLKSGGSVILHQGNAIDVTAGESFTLPVEAAMDMDITAVSLAMNYPADKVQVTGVTLAGTNDPVDFSASNGELRIGYMTPLALELKNGQPLFDLHLAAAANLKKGEQILFTLTQNPDIEIADAFYQVIPNAELSISKVETTTGITEKPAEDLLTLANHPNPFSASTTFTYNLPVGGKVSLVISDMIGRTVAEPVLEMQQPGQYTLAVNTRDLKPGAYTATLRVEADGTMLTRTIRIISNQ